MSPAEPGRSSAERGRVAQELRARVVSGGSRLLLRQLGGLLLSVGGALGLTRIIGPADYGTYAAAFGIMFFAQTMLEFSLDVFLVRYPGELSRRMCDQVFTLLLVSGVVGTALLDGLTPALSGLLGLGGAATVAVAMFSSILLVHLQQVPLSRLERRLDYGGVGVVEVVGQGVFVVVSVGAAVAGAGVWAPVAGWWLQQVALLIGFWQRDGHRPALRWDPALIREALRFGTPTTASTFAFSLRGLVNPVLVAATLGATAVGFVALAQRLLEQLGFVRNVASRLSYAVMARLTDDLPRLRRALTSGTELQLLVVGVPLSAFALLAGHLVPWIFGAQWSPVATLVPLLGPPFMVASVFALHNAVMVTAERPWVLTLSQGANALLVWSAALILLPQHGIRGFGYAECISAASYVLTDALVARRFVRPDYSVTARWFVGFTAICLAPVVTWWLLAVAIPCFGTPRSLQEAWALRSLAGPTRRRGAHAL